MFLPYRAVEKGDCILLDQRVSRQWAVGFIPLVNPVDHADQGEGGGVQDFLPGLLAGFLTRLDGSFAEHLLRW